MLVLALEFSRGCTAHAGAELDVLHRSQDEDDCPAGARTG